MPSLLNLIELSSLCCSFYFFQCSFPLVDECLQDYVVERSLQQMADDPTLFLPEISITAQSEPDADDDDGLRAWTRWRFVFFRFA